MPFIVQCPHAGCRKYMLLEDAERDQVTECLVCKSPFDVRKADEVIACPQCKTQLKLPSAAGSQSIQCAKCNHIFKTR